MTSAALPGLAFRRETSAAWRYPLVWRARDLSLDAGSGQTGTLVRASNESCRDSDNVLLTITRERPRWHAPSGVVGLALGGGSGAITEYLKWDVPLVTGVALSGLFDFIENGTAGTSGGASVGALANSSAATPRLYWTATSGNQYGITHDPTGSAAVTSVAAVTPSLGDRCRLRWWLYSDGAVQAWISVNGGAETAGTKSAAKTFGAAWSGTPTFWLNTLATTFTHGSNVFVGVSIMAGNQTAAKLQEPLR